MDDILIDPQVSRFRPDLRCNSPYCGHKRAVVELFGTLFSKYWCPECGLVSHKATDFLPRDWTCHHTDVPSLT